MEPRFESLKEKHLVGMKVMMSFANNKTGLLWQAFMPGHKKIKNRASADFYSVEVYAPDFFSPFRPDIEFEKWAAVEVSRVETLPSGMETIVIPSGLYAVFIHKGLASLGAKTYQYVLETWLPNAPYILDTRPHFAVMGEKYKNNDAESEEELWFPIVSKHTNRK